MPVIRIPFAQSPASISVARGSVPVRNPVPSPAPPPERAYTERANTDRANTEPAKTEPVADPMESAAMRSLQAIHQNLQTLDDRLNQELANLRSHLVSAARHIACEAIGSEDELVEKQVVHFAEILIGQMQPSSDVVFFVNPRCIAYLTAWLARSDRSDLAVQPDASVDPGDCRIESGDKGLLASLDSFLHEAAKKTDLARGEV